MDAPKVIYIAGHGRSGTTITDRVLSQVIGAFSAGEIHRFWEYGIARDWTCSCGAPLRECSFWGDVLRQSFSQSGYSEEDVLEAWRTVARPRSILPLCFPSLRTSRFASKLSLYRTFLGIFYEVVAEHSGNEVIVDSSGSPFHGHVLSGVSEVKATMIHLIRDARAVAFSNRKKKSNPSDPRQGAQMRRKMSVRVCITWMMYNFLFESLSSNFEKYHRIKYEEIFEDPKKRFEILLSEVGKVKMEENKFLSSKEVRFKDGHIGQGNPIRYKSGVVKLEPDTEWEKSMSYIRKSLIKLVCYRMLSKYGYE